MDAPYLKEGGRIRFLDGFNTKLDQGGGVLQMSRAGSDFFPQPLQLQVPLAASEFDERFLPPSEGVDQLGTLSVNGALDLSTALLFGPTKVSMRSTLSVTSNQSARWCGRPESNGWRCLARKISIEKETELLQRSIYFLLLLPGDHPAESGRRFGYLRELVRWNF